MQSSSVFARIRPLLVAATLIGVIVGFEQSLESGLACPTLCPQQSDSLRDIIASGYSAGAGVAPGAL